MRYVALILTAVALACAPARDGFAARPPVQAACPADQPLIRNGIKSRLSNPRLRTDMGVMHVSPDRLRVLADPADATTCQALMNRVRSAPINPDHVLRYGFYESDGHYFVGILLYTRAGVFAQQPGQLIVLAPDLRVLDASIF